MKKAIFALTFCIFTSLVIFSQTIVKKEDINKKKEWQEVYQNYTVDASLIEVIKTKIGPDLTIKIYFAFWCSDSVENVPKFIKIVDLLDNKQLKTEFFTLGRKAGSETIYYIAELKIKRIPTFIFYQGKKEIGRIIETPKSNMIDDFLKIIL